jgi:hypothetical protein
MRLIEEKAMFMRDQIHRLYPLLAGSALLLLGSLVGAVTRAHAESLTLACTYESGAFHGQSISVAVDYGSSTIVWADNQRQHADITERFISTAPSAALYGVRIDRVTGVVSFSYLVNGRHTPWDNTVFGVPGLVCRQQKGF